MSFEKDSPAVYSTVCDRRRKWRLKPLGLGLEAALRSLRDRQSAFADHMVGNPVGDEVHIDHSMESLRRHP